MKVDLLNMGFVPKPDGVYVNHETGTKIKIVDNQITIMTKDGVRIISMKDLEHIMMGGQL